MSVVARARWLVFAVAALALIGVIGPPQPLDDAFITLRYARSLAEGHGFVFNVGERVLGTTTPLFSLLLAVLHRLTAIDLVRLAWALAIAGHVATVAMLIIIGRRCRQPALGYITGSLYACAPLALFPVVGCMETSLVVLATVYCLAPSDRPRSGWRTAAATAAVLLRPEGVLIAALHLLRVARGDPRAAVRAGACIAVGVVPWVAFATWYFGSPVPQSVLAKWSYYALVPRGLVLENFWYLLVSLPSAAPKIQLTTLTAQPFGTMIAQAVPLAMDLEIRRLAVMIVGTMSLTLVCVGAVTLHRRNGQMVWLLCFAAAYIAAYCVMRPKMFPWYLTPPLPVLLLAFVAGGVATLQRLPGRLGRRNFAIAIAVGLIVLAAWQAVRSIRSFAPTARVRAYRSAVEMLGPVAQDQTTRIGAFEIGAIGYYARATIIDYFGLVSPDVPQLGVEKSIERYQPDYYIGYPWSFAIGGFNRLPAFTERYERIARVPSEGTDALLIYRRRPGLRPASFLWSAPRWVAVGFQARQGLRPASFLGTAPRWVAGGSQVRELLASKDLTCMQDVPWQSGEPARRPGAVPKVNAVRSRFTAATPAIAATVPVRAGASAHGGRYRGSARRAGVLLRCVPTDRCRVRG